jgi:hypothetical protein
VREDAIGGSTPNLDQEDSGRDLLAYVAIRVSPPPRPGATYQDRLPDRRKENAIWQGLTYREDREDREDRERRGDRERRRDPEEEELRMRFERREVPDLAQALAVRMTTSLVPRLGIPLEIRVLPRRGTIELGVLILGACALLKDYKPLRDSLVQLSDDVRDVLDIPQDWSVEVAEFRTAATSIPGASGGGVRQTAGGLIGMGGASRYAFLYLLILNILALIFFCYLTLTAVMAAST